MRIKHARSARVSAGAALKKAAIRHRVFLDNESERVGWIDAESDRSIGAR
jgi:hypothetical protein